MSQLWQHTGPLAYVIVPIGGFSILLAVLFLRSGRRETFAAAVGTGVTNLLLGVLAFVSGAHRALAPLRSLDSPDRWLVALGVGEALSCFVISLAFAVVVAALLTAGSYRALRSTPDHAAGREPATA